MYTATCAQEAVAINSTKDDMSPLSTQRRCGFSSKPSSMLFAISSTVARPDPSLGSIGTTAPGSGMSTPNSACIQVDGTGRAGCLDVQLRSSVAHCRMHNVHENVERVPDPHAQHRTDSSRAVHLRPLASVCAGSNILLLQSAAVLL
jgi:hypothetical protein